MLCFMACQSGGGIHFWTKQANQKPLLYLHFQEIGQFQEVILGMPNLGFNTKPQLKPQCVPGLRAKMKGKRKQVDNRKVLELLFMPEHPYYGRKSILLLCLISRPMCFARAINYKTYNPKNALSHLGSFIWTFIIIQLNTFRNQQFGTRQKKLWDPYIFMHDKTALWQSSRYSKK